MNLKKTTSEERARATTADVVQWFESGLDAARGRVESGFRISPPRHGLLFDCVVSVVSDPVLSMVLSDANGEAVVEVCVDVALFPPEGVSIYGRGDIAGLTMAGLEPNAVFETAVAWLSALWASSEGSVRRGLIRGHDDPECGIELPESRRCWSLHERRWIDDPRRGG